MLKIVEHIKRNGLEKTVETFSLKMKDYGHKVVLTYDQLKSNFSKKEVQEARGLILKKDTWEVMCLPFYKFFTHDSNKAATIDWNTARVLEKRDGSLVTFYFDDVLDKWCVATMNTADANGRFRANNKYTISELCFKLIGDVRLSNMNHSHTYSFELTSPYNRIVTKYDDEKITLLSIRNLKTLQESTWEELFKWCELFEIDLVEEYHYSSLNDLLDTFKNKSFEFEGYVVFDSNFNRIKVKNPAYVSTHLMKTQDDNFNVGIKFKDKPHYLMNIVKSNELDEFISSFPNTKKILTKLYRNFNHLIVSLKKIGNEIEYPNNITQSENKRFASKLFKMLDDHGITTSFSGIFFQIKDGKEINIEDYVYEMDNKKLYKLLK